MKFKSQKDILFSTIIIGTNLFLLGITLYGIFIGEMEPHEYWTLPLVLGVVVFLFWMYFGTDYELSPKGLIYRCGPMKGKIGYERIREIVKGRTLWIGFRPATARKGLIIKYDRYNEIYISPKTNEVFIDKILELKSDVNITE
ncbi:PH domain-containing protein [Flagellimonas aequoris]|uniref:Uncharacterized protein YyaB-like PH domain-containing protein n=1 Tax=Flagellimonas aequoris TaxID=2306997 RepID=A0A418N6W0_9FLAO|nr:PH domain-containing protein [Allomuricauda aequoris]RIV69913.1 hypothetical protein D2U88_12245 [Allomuricauda aequoris]TXK01500.1 hypothetical protein FQ019_12130 [Allomuricauda aequoris]